MRKNTKILVVGTTSDYIDWLQKAGPDRVLFLTDPSVRQQASEPAPEEKDEIIYDLIKVASIRSALSEHLYRWNISLAGIVCFDCESLGPAAFLAEDLALSFPSVESARICRDKYTMSSRWLKRGVKTPRFALVRAPRGAADFYNKIKKPCVLKPVSGSGSELVFCSDSESDCLCCARLLLDGIERRRENRLYSAVADCFLIEEFVPGIEYSCDFLLEKQKVRILRFSRKIKVKNTPFGTTMGYALTTCEAQGIDRRRLEALLAKAARALGLSRALCMADFLVCAGEINFLELSPRPGGDCIPALLYLATGCDMLKLALDFAEGLPVEIPAFPKDAGYAGLRLHADKPGRIREISAAGLREDPRVKTVHLIRQSGHLVILPPEDYDSWYLGHVLFMPDTDTEIEAQCLELRRLLSLEIEAGT